MLSPASQEHQCKQCKAPMNEACQCESCRMMEGIQRKHKVYCHVCEWQYIVVSQNRGLSHAHEQWKNERDQRRKNMGLQ